MLSTAATLIVSGCDIAGPGTRIRIKPLGSPAPEKIGAVTIDDREFCLFDVNGDGIPDILFDPATGQLFWVREPTDFPAPGDGADNVLPWTWDALVSDQPGGIGNNEYWWLDTHTEWDAGFDPPQPFDFGEMSAEEWIESVGLDVEPDTLVETESVEVHLLDTESWHADVTIFWSGAFGFPDLTGYELQYEMWALESEQEDAPMFLAIHVAGDVREVLRLFAAMGGEESVLDYDGSEWSVVIEDGGAFASLYQDDVWLLTVPLS